MKLCGRMVVAGWWSLASLDVVAHVVGLWSLSSLSLAHVRVHRGCCCGVCALVFAGIGPVKVLMDLVQLLMLLLRPGFRRAREWWCRFACTDLNS